MEDRWFDDELSGCRLVDRLEPIAGLPVDATVDKFQWCAMRWKIEVFHNILKSGCRIGLLAAV